MMSMTWFANHAMQKRKKWRENLVTSFFFTNFAAVLKEHTGVPVSAVRGIKRETGENPVQSRCCNSCQRHTGMPLPQGGKAV
jgi:hypothetical protein